MKKIVTFPIITLVFLSLFALGVFYSEKQADPNKLTPKKFVEQTMPEIVSNWDPEYAKSIFAMPEETVIWGLTTYKGLLGSCKLKNVSWTGRFRIMLNQPDRSEYAYVAHLVCTKGGQSTNVKMPVIVNGNLKYTTMGPSRR